LGATRGRGNPVVKETGNLQGPKKERTGCGISKVAGSGQEKKKRNIACNSASYG